MRVTGKDKGLSPLEIQFTVRAASIGIGSRVDDMLKPEALIELLGSTGAAQYANLKIGAPRLEAPNLWNFYRFIVNTEYSGLDFSIIMPFAADEVNRYRLRLRLENWEWKLVGIGLPEEVQTGIARQISAAEKKS